MGETKSLGSENLDRLSNLPDNLIHHIMSFLDMTEVVKTSLLSRRWRYLWTSVSTLTFNEFHEGFIDFVNWVFVRREKYDIQKFSLIWLEPDFDKISISLYTWILVALRSNVQDLTIDLYNECPFQFPSCIFTSKSLTRLELGLCLEEDETSMIFLPNLVNLPQLEYLKLNSILIYEKITNKFFSSLPLLKSLILSESSVLDSDRNFNISAVKLTQLQIENRVEPPILFISPNTIKLCTPNLKSFICKDYLSQDYSLGHLYCLQTADIDMVVKKYGESPDEFFKYPVRQRKVCTERMMTFFKALHNVNDLRLSSTFLEVISGASELLDICPPQRHNLKYLKLDSWLSRESFRSIMYLLKLSPNIVSLSLTIIGNHLESSQMFPFVDEVEVTSGNYWDAGSSLPCLLKHLKFVEVRGLLGCVNELKFLEILLKNSTVLEKVNLHIANSPSVPHSRVMKFNEKLQTFPRASANIMIM